MSGLKKNDLKKLLIKSYHQDFVDMLTQAKMYTWMKDGFMQEEAPTTSLLGVVRGASWSKALLEMRGEGLATLLIFISEEEKQDPLG